MTFLSFLEIDLEGNVNVSKLGKKPCLTAGCGGFVDITARRARRSSSPGSSRPARSSSSPTAAPDRQGRASSRRWSRRSSTSPSPAGARVELGQDVLYVTERCVIRLTDDGPRRRPRSTPGIDLERDIVDASLGRVSLAPDAKTLPASLLGAGPMGLVLRPDAGMPAPLPDRPRADEGGSERRCTSPSTARSPTLRLDNPAKLNALTVPMLEALDAALRDAGARARGAGR